VIEQSLVCSGQREAHDLNLLSLSTSIRIYGDVNLEVSRVGILDIKVDGAATIAYKGKSSISQNLSGYPEPD